MTTPGSSLGIPTKAGGNAFDDRPDDASRRRQTLSPIQSYGALGVVSFLNARPLWRTLERRPELTICPAVPSRLAAMLAEGKCDVALLPVVDYWRGRRRLVRVSDACIASDGETMTVRVFSRVAPEQIQRLHADADSHTSLILAQVLWRQMHARRLEIVPWAAGDQRRDSDVLPGEIEAVLLIGDKVVTAAPGGFPFQVDLGEAWKRLTGLPFVFAAWYGSKDRDHAALARLLEEARDAGTVQADSIAADEAPRRGWPVATASRYLREHMRYTLTPAMRAGMDRFFSLVHEQELVE